MDILKERSKGHMFFAKLTNKNEIYEYVRGPENTAYRAPIANPIDITTGYRLGLRSMHPKHMSDNDIIQILEKYHWKILNRNNPE